LKNNQEYAYTAQESCRKEKEQKQEELEKLTQDHKVEIVGLQKEVESLRSLLNEKFLTEEKQGNELNIIRGKLIEEIVRVQKVHQKNEDELRKDNDIISVKYSESIKTFQETIKKSEEDKALLQSKIEEIIKENKSTEVDMMYQINELTRTNKKLIKDLESKQEEIDTKSKLTVLSKNSKIPNISPRRDNTHSKNF
jgi:NhaP-type Na+/H+ and K+/H+ antiporter